MHVPAIVVSEFHFTGFVFTHGLGDIRSHSSGPRRRHQTSGTEYATKRTDDSHHVGRRDADIEIKPTIADFFGEFLLSDFVRTSGFGGELIAEVQEACFWHLKSPLQRVTGWDAPYPHATEWDYFPGPDRVARALTKAMED